MILALLLSGAAEGIGLSALLPLVNIALGPEATNMLPGADLANQNEFERTVLDTRRALVLRLPCSICFQLYWVGLPLNVYFCL